MVALSHRHDVFSHQRRGAHIALNVLHLRFVRGGQQALLRCAKVVDEWQFEDGGLGGSEPLVDAHDSFDEFVETLHAIRRLELTGVPLCLQLVFGLDEVEQILQRLCAHQSHVV